MYKFSVIALLIVLIVVIAWHGRAIEAPVAESEPTAVTIQRGFAPLWEQTQNSNAIYEAIAQAERDRVLSEAMYELNNRPCTGAFC
ncbi:MAG: hypothetical protein IIA64_04900 [Planctomycetes bacterium]|nr:hypothetical protein [Planctomycetota bacterium]